MKNGNPIGGLKIVSNAENRFNRINNINIRLNQQNPHNVNNLRNGENQLEQAQQGENNLRIQNMNQNSRKCTVLSPRISILNLILEKVS